MAAASATLPIETMGIAKLGKESLELEEDEFVLLEEDEPDELDQFSISETGVCHM